MRAVILAAGQGTRLYPHTKDKPKCMVEYQREPIISHTLRLFQEKEFSEIVCATGYKEEMISFPGLVKAFNPRFADTNMVYSLFSVPDVELEDVLISYGDITYREEVLNTVLSTSGEAVVAVDRRWRELWELRMEDPLTDAETLKLKENNQVIEIGKKPKSLAEIEGQFIGLIKLSSGVLKILKNIFLETQNSDNMYMTDLLQAYIEQVQPLTAAFIDGGWLEFDTPSDLELEML